MSSIITQIALTEETQKVDEGTKYHNFRVPINTIVLQTPVEYATELAQGYQVYTNFRMPFATVLSQLQIEFSEVLEVHTRTVQVQ